MLQGYNDVDVIQGYNIDEYKAIIQMLQSYNKMSQGYNVDVYKAMIQMLQGYDIAHDLRQS